MTRTLARVRPSVLAAAIACLAGIAAVSCERAAPPATPPTVAPATPSTPAARVGPKVFPMEMAPALDDPGRDSWQRPDAVVDALKLRPGDRVADIGCGTGYFTARLLRAVGPAGHVLAVDIQQGMLDLLAGRLDAGQRKQMTLRCSAPERPLEPDDALDVVFCANTLHEVDDAGQEAFVKCLASGLAPRGRLVLVNWLPRPMQIGPPLANRISPDRVRALATAAGLVLVEDVALLPTHSFLVFSRPE